MVLMADILRGTNRNDLKRIANNEKVPYRGKKKHFTQMSKVEKDYLLNSLKKVEKWKMSSHSLDRLVEKGIKATYEDVVSTVHNGSIMEYHIGKHNEKNDDRVLLRANAIVNNNYNLHVVYSLTRKQIVSVWMNELNDKHVTLDMSAYDKNMKILKK